MCGIYAGKINLKDGLENLKRLRFRGADSWGVGTFNESAPIVHRELGRDIKVLNITVDGDLNNLTECKLYQTRWSSESPNTIENSQPCLSHDNSVLLVHNGSLTNYKKIQTELEDYYQKDTHGLFSYKNRSDSVVLTDYISRLWNGDNYCFEQWKEKIDSEFGGTYAIVFLMRGVSSISYMVRDVPLYYYEGQFGSESSLFPEYFELPNNSYGYTYEDSVEGHILSINGKVSKPNYIRNTIEIPEEDCRMNESVMLREIKEQSLLSLHYNFPLPSYGDDLDIVACGSSFNAGLLGKRYFDETLYYRHVSVHYASEYNYKKRLNTKYICISQSGETADLLEVMKKIQNENFSSIVLLTNHQNSSCAKLATHVYCMNVGEEKAIAATKSFTASCLMLLSLALPHTYANIDFDKFRSQIDNIISDWSDIKRIAKKILTDGNLSTFFVLGSGFQYSVGREVALKLKEVANIHAEAMPAGEKKHGPISLCGSNYLGIFMMPNSNDNRYDRILNNAKQIKARGGKLLGIGPNFNEIFDWWITIPSNSVLLQPLLNNIAGQILSYEMAIFKGLDPSFSKHCAKSITVY